MPDSKVWAILYRCKKKRRPQKQEAIQKAVSVHLSDAHGHFFACDENILRAFIYYMTQYYVLSYSCVVSVWLNKVVGANVPPPTSNRIPVTKSARQPMPIVAGHLNTNLRRSRDGASVCSCLIQFALGSFYGDCPHKRII